MKITKRINGYDTVIDNIKTVVELEEFVRKYNIINDFKCFRLSDYNKMEKMLVETEQKGIYKFHRHIKGYGIFNTKLKNIREYWLCRGFTEIETTEKIRLLQSMLGKRGMTKFLSNPNYKEKLNTCKEYWLKRGLSDVEAELALKNRQRTFTLEKCIEKFGREAGEERYNTRQKKWIDKLYNNKTDEEKYLFNKKRGVKTSRASKQSLKIFLPVIENLLAVGVISDEDYYLGYNEKNEYPIRYKNIHYFYDFCIPKLKKIIEFNGIKFHIKNFEEQKNEINPYGKSLREVYAVDKIKLELAKTEGFDVLTIWSDELESVNIKKCLEFLNYEKNNDKN